MDQSKYRFDQQLKNHLAYLNFDAIFDFLDNLLSDAYIIFQKVLIILR